MNFQNWYNQNNTRMSNFGIWFRGGEINTLDKSLWNSKSHKILITRLSSYTDTSNSFTHNLLYQIAAENNDNFPDLSFLPPSQDAKIFDNDHIPWMIGTNSKYEALDFDLIAFSNSIVQEMVNLPRMLQKSNIPLSKKERMSKPEIPLIILGGANALYSSVFWTADPPVDGIYIGEDPDAIRQIFDICKDSKGKFSKLEILLLLEKIDGFIQPENERKTQKSQKSNTVLQLENAPVNYTDGQAGSGTLQISEGCPYFCSFCSESWGRKPYREVPMAELMEKAMLMKATQALDNIEIYSFNFNIHSEFYDLLWNLSDKFASIGLKSQRFDHLGRNPEMLKYLQDLGKLSLTCGLEGISTRIRTYLHKNLPDSDLIRSLDYILKSPIRELKIFLIATGLEDSSDFQVFDELLEKISVIMRQSGRRPRIVFSMTPLVRFPFTPLEFADAPLPEKYLPVLHAVEQMVKNYEFEFRNSADLNENYLSQLLVRASDERIFAAMWKAVQQTDFVYYEEVSHRFLHEFLKQLTESGLSPETLMKGHSLEERAQKPWANIKTGISEKYLYNQYENCIADTETEACLATSSKKGKCSACGACPDEEHRTNLTSHKQARNVNQNEFHDKIVRYRKYTDELKIVASGEKIIMGLPRKMFAVAVVQAILKTAPKFTDAYFGFKNSLWAMENPNPWIYGVDCLSTLWRNDALPELMELMKDADFVAKVNANMDQRWGQVIGISDEPKLKTYFEVFSPFDYSGQNYWQQKYVKFNPRKTGENAYKYEIAKESFKREQISELSYRKTEEGTYLEITPGQKFDALEFAKKAFKLAKPSDFVRTEICAKLK